LDHHGGVQRMVHQQQRGAEGKSSERGIEVVGSGWMRAEGGICWR
jgi:hypothetical protein